jgi:hypothetical protein
MRRACLSPDELYERRRENGLRGAEARWRDHTLRAVRPWRPKSKREDWWEWTKEIKSRPQEHLALEHLDLSVRTLNALEIADITTIGDLADLTATEAAGLAGSLGQKEIKDALARRGMKLSRKSHRKPPAPPPAPRASFAARAAAPKPPPPAPPTPQIPAAYDYPRMLFHRTLPPVTVTCREEEDALGSDWSRRYQPPPPPLPQPRDPSLPLPWQPYRKPAAPPAVAPVGSLADYIRMPVSQQAAAAISTWQELAERLGYSCIGDRLILRKK